MVMVIDANKLVQQNKLHIKKSHEKKSMYWGGLCRGLNILWQPPTNPSSSKLIK